MNEWMDKKLLTSHKPSSLSSVKEKEEKECLKLFIVCVCLCACESFIVS